VDTGTFWSFVIALIILNAFVIVMPRRRTNWLLREVVGLVVLDLLALSVVFVAIQVHNGNGMLTIAVGLVILAYAWAKHLFSMHQERSTWPKAMSQELFARTGCPHCHYPYGVRIAKSRGGILYACTECQLEYMILEKGQKRASVCVPHDGHSMLDHLRRQGCYYPHALRESFRIVPRVEPFEDVPENGGEYLEFPRRREDGEGRCFVCKSKKYSSEEADLDIVYGDVATPAIGRRIVTMLKEQFRFVELVYDPSDPMSRHKVKFSACSLHRLNLALLRSSVTANGGIITPEQIIEVLE
jgi:hypothetical protein